MEKYLSPNEITLSKKEILDGVHLYNGSKYIKGATKDTIIAEDIDYCDDFSVFFHYIDQPVNLIFKNCSFCEIHIMDAETLKIKCELSFVNCTFEARTVFSNCHFKQAVSFINTCFKGSVNFENIKYDRIFYFENIKMLPGYQAYFTFNNLIRGSSHIDNKLVMFKTDFECQVNFLNCDLQNAEFELIKFHDRINFKKSIFSLNSKLKHVSFASNIPQYKGYHLLKQLLPPTHEFLTELLERENKYPPVNLYEENLNITHTSDKYRKVYRAELTAFLKVSDSWAKKIEKEQPTHLTPYKEGKFTYYALDQVKRFLKQYYKHSANCNILIQKVIDYCIPVQKIKTTDLNQKIVPEITEMLTYRYSHIPVLDNNKIIGVLSYKNMLTYIIEKNLNDSLEKITVSELSNIITQDKLSYKIVAPNTFIKDVKKLFSPQNNASRELEVVYITDNGKANGNLLGMVTAADIASW